MTSTASSSMASLTPGGGQRSPRMCSLRASPDPTPKKNRPSNSNDVVAVAWAMIAGWMRMMGQVTPTPTRSRSVVAAIPPSTDHTNGLWPWAVTHGW